MPDINSSSFLDKKGMPGGAEFRVAAVNSLKRPRREPATRDQDAYSAARFPVSRTISPWSTSLTRRSRGTDVPAGPA